MKSFFDLLICSHAPYKVWSGLKYSISVCTRKIRPLTCSRQLNLHKIPIYLLLVKNFAPIEKSTQQTAQLLATNMSLRLCLQTKQYTYYFSKSLTWNLFHIVKSRNDYTFSVFIQPKDKCFLQTSLFLFGPRSREQNDEYKCEEGCFPAKVSLLLRGSEGLREEVDVCPYTFVPKVPSYIFN